MPRFLGLGNGKDGVLALGSFTQVNVTCSGTSGSTSLTATGSFNSGDRLFIHQSRGGANVGKYEDNRVASYSSGTITLVHPLENTYTDSGASQAQVVVVPEASSVTGSYTTPAWDGDKGGLTVIACSGTFSGTITATGKGFRGSSATTDSWGGDPQNAPVNFGYYAEGTVGASASASNASANGNGAGASSNGTDVLHFCAGSGGSNSTGATTGGQFTSSGTAGNIGATVGQADLSTGVFLGGGGAGARGHRSTSYLGNGGNGGGIVVIYANQISNTASFVVNGSAGTAGTSAGGGGGAGGTVLIKSKSSTIGTITASGGAGGNSDYDGGVGGDGRIRIESCSLSGTTTPTASTSTGGHSYCGSATFIM